MAKKLETWARRIESNVKGLGEIELPGPKVVVVGPNGFGKSRIVQALELGTTGVVSDVNGRRTISKGVELLSLAPGRVGPLFSRVFFDDHTNTTYQISGDTSKSSGERLVLPSWLDGKEKDAFPLRNLMDALLGSPATMRKFFVGFAGEPKKEEILAAIEKKGGKEAVTMFRVAEQSGTPKTGGEALTEILVRCLEYAKKQSNSEKAKGETKRDAAVEVGREIGTPVDDVALAEAETELRTAKKQLEAAVMAEGRKNDIIARYEKAQESAEHRKSLVDHAQELLLAVQKIVESWAKKRSIAKEKLDNIGDGKVASAIRTIVEFMVENQAPCPISGVEVDEESLTALYEDASSILSAFDEATADLEKTDAEVAESSRRFIEAKDRFDDARDLYNSAIEEMKRLEAEFESLEIDDIETLRAEIEAHEKSFIEMKESAAAWAAADKAAQAAVESDIESAKWKILADILSAIIENALDGGLKSFIERVQGYLPEGDVFDLRLRDGGREVCQYGLVTDDMLLTALSGGEWARVTAAMALACRNDKLRWSCIVPEDRSWHPVILAAVLDAWMPVDAQFIVTTCVAPSSIPDGWKVVEVG